MLGYELEIDDENRAYAALSIRKFDGSGYEPIFFKFDTGADTTTISPQDLIRLGYHREVVEDLMRYHGDGSNATNETQRHFTIMLKLTHIFGQLIPKDLEFPFLCTWQRDVPIPKLGCGGYTHGARFMRWTMPEIIRIDMRIIPLRPSTSAGHFSPWL